jgi:hypothetical protein
MENVALLISEYIDDELDDESAAVLTARLKEDATAVDDLVLTSFIHSQLIDLISQRRVQRNVVGDSFDENDVADTARRQAGWAGRPTSLERIVSEGRQAAPVSRTHWLRNRLALAATLLIAACLFIVAYNLLSRPAIVAQLSKSAGCRWQIVDSELPIGVLLRAGQELNLIEGRALVTFVSGAQIVLEGPTKMCLDSPMATELASGRITASVPTQAIGFSVSSPMARFVDLGTEFALKLDVDKGYVLQVFDGLVEVQSAVRDGDASQKPLRISELTAVRFHAGSGKIVVEPYDESERLSL